MNRKLPENLNPYTKKKFEAIHTYDPYEGAIKELNQAFHTSYNLLIHHAHEKLGKAHTPVIVIHGTQAMLFHEDRQETVEIIPYLYHLVKAISHVSFGVYVTLANNGYGALTLDNREDMEAKCRLIEQALSVLDEESIPANYAGIQRQTLENALAMITEVLSSGQVEQERVAAFGRDNASLYLDNAALGAILELDVLHETVMRWKEQLGPENWQALYVVICGGHQARYREVTRQYFERLLHQQEGLGADREDRVVYAEHINEVEAALDLLARHIVDQTASVALFNSRTRLQQDLMADGAAAYLAELLPG